MVHRVLEQHIQFYLFAVIILMLGAAFHVKMIVFNSENIHIILIFEYSGLILNNIHINISRFKFAKLLQFFLQLLCNAPPPPRAAAPCFVMDSEAAFIIYGPLLLLYKYFKTRIFAGGNVKKSIYKLQLATRK